LDSEDPFWYRNAVSTMYMPIWRNSDSQFSNVASTKSPEDRYCHIEICSADPCWVCSWL